MKNKILLIVLIFSTCSVLLANEQKNIAYMVSDIKIPFWNIMAKGIKAKAKEKGYSVNIYSANNIKKTEIQNIVKIINQNTAGLIISPINSSTAVTILKFANKADIPVVISDIGTDSGDYISYISSNNKKGAYDIGKVLVKKMKELGYDKNGSVGIVSIPLKRENGKLRTAGFMKALDEANIKSAGLLQQIDFSYEETYNHTKKLIEQNPNLKAIWLQGSDKYKGALEAIKDSGKTGKILLLCFDAEPEFLELIPKDILIGAAMQQPYLMGQKAVESLDAYINGKPVKKTQELEILAISKDNIKEKLQTIKKNVLGIEK